MFSFNPFDSDTYPEPEFEETAPMELDEQGNPIFPPPTQMPMPVAIEDSSSDDSDPHVASDPNENSIHMSDLKNIRTVLSILTHFPGGNLTTHLKQFPGLICLPLSAVSMLRKPSGNHINNPPAIIYLPLDGPDAHPHMVNFNEAIRLIGPPPQ